MTKKHFTKITDASPLPVKKLYNTLIHHCKSLSKMYDDFEWLKHNKHKSRYKEFQENILDISLLPTVPLAEVSLRSEEVENVENQEAHIL